MIYWMRLWSRFGTIVAQVWLHFASMLAPFGAHFGSEKPICPPMRATKSTVYRFWTIRVPILVDLGPICELKSTKNNEFWWIGEPFWTPKAFQNDLKIIQTQIKVPIHV